MNANVKITPTKEGNLVTPYAGNPDYGYIMLSQTKSAFSNGWLKEVTNRTILKGTTASLEGFVQANSTLELPGNLVIKEYLEDAVPENISNAHFDDSLSFEEQIANYIKRAGEDGPELKVDDKRILRFTVWDTAGTEVDLTLQHTNVEEVKVFSNAKKKSADLSK
jgi:hypothetical protein